MVIEARRSDRWRIVALLLTALLPALGVNLAISLHAADDGGDDDLGRLELYGDEGGRARDDQREGDEEAQVGSDPALALSSGGAISSDSPSP